LVCPLQFISECHRIRQERRPVGRRYILAQANIVFWHLGAFDRRDDIIDLTGGMQRRLQQHETI
jgi:hypothetical protein